MATRDFGTMDPARDGELAARDDNRRDFGNVGDVLAENTQQVTNGFAKAVGADVMRHLAVSVMWRTLAEQELQRRTAQRLLEALSEEELAAIAAGEVNMAEICGLAAETL